MPATKYKIGDKVTVIKKENGHQFDIGQEITITEVRATNVQATANGDSWALAFNEIKSNKTKNKTMATSKATSKTTGKKAAVKKAVAAVTETPVKRVIKVVPLDSYAGYSVKRDATQIKFGCGRVTVDKKDLLIVANAIDGGFKKIATKAEKIATKISSLTAKPEEVKAFADSYTSFPEVQKALGRLVKGARGMRSRQDILKISPTTLRRIVG